MRAARSVLLMGLAGLAASCAADGDKGSLPRGTRWRSALVTSPPGAPDGLTTDLELLIADDGQISMTANCNQISGFARVKRDRLDVTEVNSTEMECSGAHAAEDAWLETFLKSAPTIERDQATLTLAGNGALIEFTQERPRQ